ncbi:DUF6245 family protein [Streptosporangium canum]
MATDDKKEPPICGTCLGAAEGLQKLLGVAGTGQVPDVEAVKEGVAEMRAARQCLDNIDILLEMLSGLSVFPDKD